MTVDLERLKELQKASTQGQWLLVYAFDDTPLAIAVFDEEAKKRYENTGLGPVMWHEKVFPCWATGEADCYFVIALQNAFPHLVAEIETLRERVKQLEGQAAHDSPHPFGL